MSVRVLGKVLRESDEKLARRLILIVLADAASDDGVTWVDQETIARKARLSRTHVTERLREMDAESVVEIRKAQRGRRRVAVYRVVLDGLDEIDYDRLPFTLDRPFTTSEPPTSSAADDVGSTGTTTSDLPRNREVSPLVDPLGEPLETSSALARRDDDEPVELARDGAPPLAKIDGRDVAFDALAEVCGVDPRGNRSREVGVALHGSKTYSLAHGIRALAWRAMSEGRLGPRAEPGEEFERLLAATIRVRADRYRRTMSGALLTPLALAKWWTDLDDASRVDDPAQRLLDEAQRLHEEGR